MNEKDFILNIKNNLDKDPQLYMECCCIEELPFKLDFEILKQEAKKYNIYVKKLNETKTKKKTYTKEYERIKTTGFSYHDF